MTDYLITYDMADGSPDPHKPFLTAAEKEGLLYVWKGATYVNRLPNTTIWGVFDSLEAANAAFDRAKAQAENTLRTKITLEKRCTTTMRNSNALSNRRKLPESKWTGDTSFMTSRLHQKNDPFFK